MTQQTKLNRITLPTDKFAEAEGCYFDDKAFDNVKAFVKKYLTIELLDWQLEFVATLFGWKRKNKKRRFRAAQLWIGKKQGKSLCSSVIAAMYLFSPKRTNSYIIASTKDQAKIIWNHLCDIVKPQYKKRYLWIREHLDRIENKKTNSELKVLSSTPTGLSGLNADYVAFDELADYKKVYAQDVWDKLANSTMARDGLTLVSSTSQFDLEHVGYKQYKRCKSILEGDSQEWTTLPLIYEVPLSCDWTKEENWWPALPSIDQTVSRDYYRDEYSLVKNDILAYSRFRTLLLNQWGVGNTKGWLPQNLWWECRSDRTEDYWHLKECVIGVDASTNRDLTGYSLVFEENGHFWVYPRAFVPKLNIRNKSRTDGVNYEIWSQTAKLYLTEGNVIDTNEVVNKILEDSKKFRIRQIRCDASYFRDQMQVLIKHGFHVIDESTSNRNMSPAFSRLDELIRSQRIHHPNCPVLNSHFENVRATIDKQERLVLQKGSETQRIDLIDSICVALQFWLSDKTDNQYKPPNSPFIFSL